MTDTRPYDVPIIPVHARWSSGLTANLMIMYASLAIPAPPTTGRARPKISAIGLGETPQMRLPSSKMNTDRSKVYWQGVPEVPNSKTLPLVDWKGRNGEEESWPDPRHKVLRLNVQKSSAKLLFDVSRTFWM